MNGRCKFPNEWQWWHRSPSPIAAAYRAVSGRVPPPPKRRSKRVRVVTAPEVPYAR